MKRLLIGLSALLLVGTSAYAFEERSLMFKLGIVTGEIETDTAEGKEDLDTNLSIGLEYIFRWENGIDAGLGVSFEKHELESAKFNFGLNHIDTYPVYGILRYRFDPWKNLTPYVYGNLGYAFGDESKGEANIDGGMYYGMGAGIEYVENLALELGWSRTEFDGEDRNGNSFDPESDLIKLSVVMRLDH